MSNGYKLTRGAADRLDHITEDITFLVQWDCAGIREEVMTTKRALTADESKKIQRYANIALAIRNQMHAGPQQVVQVVVGEHARSVNSMSNDELVAMLGGTDPRQLLPLPKSQG